MDTPNISQPAAHGRLTKVILIVVVLAVLLAAAWWLSSNKAVAPATPVAAPGTANQPTQDLGTTLYNSASNPVSGKLPDTAGTVPNPIQGMYTNPF